MDTIKRRLEYLVELISAGKHTVFAKKCGIPPGSFQAYINGERVPPAEHLMKLVTVYGINLNWLLVGEGEPFIAGKTQEEKATPRGEAGAIDPVVQLLNDEEEIVGITLTLEQRTAILKIFRELVERDIRAIRELLRSIQGGKKKEDG
jgi:hypothetical protein